MKPSLHSFVNERKKDPRLPVPFFDSERHGYGADEVRTLRAI